MSWYRDGTISLTKNGATVTGVGTKFSTEIRYGDILLIAGALYEVARVLSDTEITLASPFQGASVADSAYAVIRNLTNASNYDLMKKIEGFLTDRQRSLDEFVNWLNGLAGGGESKDGKFPLTDRYGVTVKIKAPAQIAAEIEALKAQTATDTKAVSDTLSAAQAKLDALGDQQAWADQILGYKNAAAASASAAKTSETNAKTSETNSKTSETNAKSSETSAATSKTSAATSATSAGTSATAAKTSETNAKTSETNAGSSAAAASTSASAAKTSETNASSSATSAATSASNASTSASSSATSASTAQKWAENGVDSPVTTGAYSAKHHATKASTSASNAAASAANAAGSATSAANSAAAAKTSEANAATSAGNAASSQASADTAASNAAASEAAAKTSETNAKTSESNAAGSKTAASASQTASKTSETNAAASASAASTSAAAAKTSETNAKTSETNASKSASDSAASAASSESARQAAEQSAADARNSAAIATGALTEAGAIDLSSNVYPTKPVASCFWKVTKGGTVNGVDYGIGDTLVYSKNLDDFYKIDNTESVSSVNGKQGAVTLVPADLGAAPLNSASLTGTPTAPTPPVADNSTRLATTAALMSQLAAFGLTNTQSAQVADLNALRGTKLFGFDANTVGAPTGALVSSSSYDANGLQIEAYGQRTQIVCLTAGDLLFRVDDSADASGFGPWAKLVTTDSPVFTGLFRFTGQTIKIDAADGTNNGLEIGSTVGATTPFIDMHSGAAATDYDVRLIASGGNGAAGGGQLRIISAILDLTAAGTVNVPTVAVGANTKAAVNTELLRKEFAVSGLAGEAINGNGVDLNTVTPGTTLRCEGTASNAATLNWPVTGAAGTAQVAFTVMTMGLPGNGARMTQFATEVFGAATARARTWFRVKHDGTWYPWEELLQIDNVVGTTNQVTVTSSNGRLVISAPQDLHSAAVPTFANLISTNAPTQDAHVVNKGYLESLSPKNSVRVATAGALETGAAGSSTITGKASSVSTTGTVTSGSNAVTALSNDTLGLKVGATVAGTGIPAGTTVTAINTPTSITLSAAATASGTGVALTFTQAIAALVIDGVTVALNDRVLVKNYPSQARNGIYTLTTLGTSAVAWVLTRSSDAANWNDLVGAYTVVEEGTVNKDRMYQCTSNRGGAIGSTAITWQEILTDASTSVLRPGDHGIGLSTSPLYVFAAAGDWAKPAGWSGFVNLTGSVNTPDGKSGSYIYYQILGRRDAAGGYAAIAVEHASQNIWYGQSATDTGAPTWSKLWHSGNFTPSAVAKSNKFSDLDDQVGHWLKGTSAAGGWKSVLMQNLDATGHIALEYANSTGIITMSMQGVNDGNGGWRPRFYYTPSGDKAVDRRTQWLGVNDSNVIEAAAPMQIRTGGYLADVTGAGLVVKGDATDGTQGITVNNFAPTLALVDRSTGAYSTRWKADSSVLYLEWDNADRGASWNASVASITRAGEFRSVSPNNYRIVAGSYGTFWRNDGAALYLLITASGDQYGSWNSLRPFSVNLSTGKVDMSNGLTTVTPALDDVSFNAANTRFVQNLMQSFGLGATAVQALADADSKVIKPGWYQTTDTTTGTLPTTYGVMLVSSLANGGSTNTWANQMFYAATGKVYYRSSTNLAAWSAWREFTFTDSPTFTGMATFGDGSAGAKLKIGDDATLNDINSSGTFAVKGIGDPTKGYIAFGNQTAGFGWNGSNLVYGASKIWHEGNFVPGNVASMNLYAPTTGNVAAGGGGIVNVKSDGVTEIGRILDWHLNGDTSSDYKCRLECGSDGNLYVNTAGSPSGFIWHSGNVNVPRAGATSDTNGMHLQSNLPGAIAAISTSSAGDRAPALTVYTDNQYASSVIGLWRYNYAVFLGLDTDNQFKIGGRSMGSAAYPIWHDGMDTTTRVKNAIATTGGGEVGSYAFLWFNGNADPGNTVAGSQLYWGSYNAKGFGGLTGTWRCMGYVRGDNATLWVRVN